MMGLEPTTFCIAKGWRACAPVRARALKPFVFRLFDRPSERERTRANAEPCHSCHDRSATTVNSISGIHNLVARCSPKQVQTEPIGSGSKRAILPAPHLRPLLPQALTTRACVQAQAQRWHRVDGSQL
jgi:hypothetical protein